MKTGKVTNIVRTFTVECPYCGGDVANDGSGTGTIEFRDNESNGQTGTCTSCLRVVRLPKMARSGDEPRALDPMVWGVRS